MGNRSTGFPSLGRQRKTGEPLIPALERGLLLRMPKIDNLHQEFADMVNQLEHAKAPEFEAIFDALLEHTQLHFSYENNLMREINFPLIEEHMGEHQRVLDQLAELQQEIEQGEIEEAREYVCERLPKWFRFHVINMDTALVNHLDS